MNEAVQIGRCNGELSGNHVLVRPSFLPPPPAQRADLKISNRESLRLETTVTQTKQRTRTLSNREENARFSNRVRAVNRLCDCQTINSARRSLLTCTGEKPTPA
jgi:hypothetical protein